MLNEEYIEELSVLIGLGFVLLLSNLELLLLSWSLSETQGDQTEERFPEPCKDCLQAERVGVDKSALKDIVCACGYPGLPFLPKSESESGYSQFQGNC